MAERRAVIAAATDLQQAAAAFPNLEGMEAAFVAGIHDDALHAAQTLESIKDGDIDDEALEVAAHCLSQARSWFEMWHRTDNLKELEAAHQSSQTAAAVLSRGRSAAASIVSLLDESRQQIEEMIAAALARNAVAEQQLEAVRRESSAWVLEARDAVEGLKEHQGEAKRIQGEMASMHQLVTEGTVSGVYQKKADAEQKRANRWRAAFVGAIALTVLGALYLIGSTSFDDINAFRFFGKIGLAVPMATFAAYASRQSAEHRFEQRETEHTAMQLTALRPYLHGIASDDDRNQVVMRLADQIIGRPRPTKDIPGRKRRRY